MIKILFSKNQNSTENRYICEELPGELTRDWRGVPYFSAGADGCICMNQHGPTCGLYALALILRKITGKRILATRSDKLPIGDFLETRVEPPLLELAIRNGYSQFGEIFDPEHIRELYRLVVAETAKRELCRIVSCTDGSFLPMLINHLNGGGLAMVPFHSGDIKSAHWVVAVGYVTEESLIKKIVILTYGLLTDFPVDMLMYGNETIPEEVCEFTYDDIKPVVEDLQKYQSYPELCEVSGWRGYSERSKLAQKLILFDM